MAPDVAPARPASGAIERLEEHVIVLDPEAIEGEFTRIWRETAGAGYDESSVRLRVLNFVAVGRGESASASFERVMEILPERHPCRGILAVTGGSGDELRATIAAHCWRTPSGNRHVCSEEVMLAGAAEREAELASAVLALLVPEVAVSAWFIDGPPAGYLAEEVLDVAERALFDTARASSPTDAYRAVLDAARRYGVMLSDLAWGRLETWRVMAAQLFDGDDGPRELAQVRAIRVTGGLGAGSSEPVLLAAWLASRLRLSIAGVATQPDGSLKATLYAGSRGITLQISPSAESALRELRISTADAEFVIESHGASGHIHVIENWDSGSQRRAVEQLPSDDGSIIALALDGAADGGIYTQALETALSLLSAE